MLVVYLIYTGNCRHHMYKGSIKMKKEKKLLRNLFNAIWDDFELCHKYSELLENGKSDISAERLSIDTIQLKFSNIHYAMREVSKYFNKEVLK